MEERNKIWFDGERFSYENILSSVTRLHEKHCISGYMPKTFTDPTLEPLNDLCPLVLHAEAVDGLPPQRLTVFHLIDYLAFPAFFRLLFFFSKVGKSYFVMDLPNLGFF